LFFRFSSELSDARMVTGLMNRFTTNWEEIRQNIVQNFGLSSEQLTQYDNLSKADILKGYEMMLLSSFSTS
jgi:hypothetical protein